MSFGNQIDLSSRKEYKPGNMVMSIFFKPIIPLCRVSVFTLEFLYEYSFYRIFHCFYNDK